MISPMVPPIWGGIHLIYGLYIGGSLLNDNYLPMCQEGLTYQSNMQHCDVNLIASIEGAIISTRNSTTRLKFDRHLEPNIHLSATKKGKDRFITLLAWKVEDLGQETFYHVKNDAGNVVDIFEHSHNFTIDTIVQEFEERKMLSHPGAFNDYELDKIVMSQLVVESLLSSSF
jgi:hypothetical protein